MSDINISNEQYQSAFFEALHNLLWNDAGLDPQKALEHMTFFFSYRLIEPQVEKLGLPETCKWSYMAKQTDTQTLFDVMKNAVTKFRTNIQTKPYFNPPSINKAALIQRIVAKVNELDIDSLRKTDTLGNIYEYMLSRGMSTMSDEGQYFTNRKICNLAFDLAYDVKRTVRRDDGTLCTFADFFCGTGGFASSYINGVKKIISNVNWENEKESIYCLDKNLSSVQTTLLNMLILTGTPFNINKIKEHNSFHNNIVYPGTDSAGFLNVKFDYIFMNPPYGGDKSKGKDYKFKYTSGKGKDKQYHVNKEIQSIGVEDNDKVSAGVQLAMATLSNDGGVCCIVLPQGFFFGSSKKIVELRKRLTEEYKVHYVVDIASGEFANTGTKTSMIVFESGVGSTDTVRFMDINKTIINEVKLQDLRQKSYIYNCNVYKDMTMEECKGFDVIELRHLVDCVKESQLKTFDTYQYVELASVKEGMITTTTYSKADLPGRATYKVQKGDILYGTIRPNQRHYAIVGESDLVDNLIVSNGFVVLRTKANADPYYIYLCLTRPEVTKHLHSIGELQGTTYPTLKSDNLLDVKIQLPPFHVQQQIVLPIDAWMGMAQAEEKLVEQLEKAVMSHIHILGMNASKVKLEDILIQQKGKKYNVSEGKEEGTYPLLRSSKDGKCKWLDSYTFKGPFIAIGTGGIANIHLKESFNISTHFLVFNTTENALVDFVYYTMLERIADVDTKTFQGTTLRNMNVTAFMDYQIPLPQIEDQQILQGAFAEIRNKKQMIKFYKHLAEEYIDKSIPKY